MQKWPETKHHALLTETQRKRKREIVCVSAFLKERDRVRDNREKWKKHKEELTVENMGFVVNSA